MNMRVQMEKEVINDISETNNIYDIVALCIEYLNKKIKNQTLFISKYVDDKKKLNQRVFIEFVRDVITIIGSFDSTKHDRIKTEIISKIESLELYTDESGLYEKALIMYYLLRGIDSVADSMKKSNYFVSNGPVNTILKNSIAVYLKNGRTLQDDLIAKYGRKRPGSSGITSVLKAFYILDIRKLDGMISVPKIIPLSISNELYAEYYRSKKLKVAVIPVTRIAEISVLSAQLQNVYIWLILISALIQKTIYVY